MTLRTVGPGKAGGSPWVRNGGSLFPLHRGLVGSRSPPGEEVGGVPCQGWAAHSPPHAPGLPLPPGESSSAASCTTSGVLVALGHLLLFLLTLA